MTTDIFAKKIWLLINLSLMLSLLFANANLISVLAQESTTPIISVLSPESTSYSTSNIDLTFTLSEDVFWIGYSLDGSANQTVEGNLTLSSLSEGSHDIVIYATNLGGNTGVSSVVSFEISLPHQDTSAPNVDILSPENATYSARNLGLNISLSEPVSWIGYSVDGANNITISGNSTIWALYDGYHSLVVYATDLSGNTGKSELLLLTIDTRPPTVIIWPPGNNTYPTSDLDVVFTLSEDVSWIGYSLDGSTNQTVDGNFTLYSLSEGSHRVVVYADDNIQNSGRSNTVFFSIDTTLPVVTVKSPVNATYSVNNVTVNFNLYEEVSWIGYSLDGSANQTVDGNFTLYSLPDGSHNLVIYARDAKKINTGNSSAIFFSVDTTPPNVVIKSPVDERIYTTTNNITLSFTVNEEASLKYCLDGQSNVSIIDSILLYNLTNGVHNLTIYAEDSYGNKGATGLVTFTVDVERMLEPVEIIVISIIILAGFSLVIILGYRNKSRL